MMFGEVDIDKEKLRLFGELLRKTDFLDHIHSVLDQSLRFPIKNASLLEDRLWEIWSDWQRKQKVADDEIKGFYARIILGLLATLINSYAEGADNLARVLGPVLDLFGINKSTP